MTKEVREPLCPPPAGPQTTPPSTKLKLCLKLDDVGGEAVTEPKNRWAKSSSAENFAKHTNKKRENKNYWVFVCCLLEVPFCGSGRGGGSEGGWQWGGVRCPAMASVPSETLRRE